MLDYIANAYIFLIYLSEALSLGYIILRTSGFYTFLFTTSIFLFFSIYHAKNLLKTIAITTNDLIRKCNKHKAYQIIAAIVVSLGMFYCIFVFRANAIYITGLFIRLNVINYIILLTLLIFILPASIISSLILTIDVIEKIVNIDSTYFLIYALLTPLAYYLSTTMTPMLIRSGLSFAQLFFHKPYETMLVGFNQFIKTMVFSIVFINILSCLYDLLLNLYKQESFDFINIPLIAIRAWAYGRNVAIITNKNFFTAIAVQAIDDISTISIIKKGDANISNTLIIIIAESVVVVLASTYVPLTLVFFITLFVNITLASSIKIQTSSEATKPAKSKQLKPSFFTDIGAAVQKACRTLTETFCSCQINPGA